MKTIDTLFPSALDGADNAPARRLFHYPMTAPFAIQHLQICYREEVEARGGAFQETDNILTDIRLVAEWLTDTSRRPWLVLGGGLGLGKTIMVHAINRLAGKAKKFCKQSAEVASWRGEMDKARFFNAATRLHRAPAICTAKQLANWASSQEETPIYTAAVNEPFLAIDELGTEPSAVKLYGTERLPLADLLAARYDSRLPTIITTNLGPAGIAERYGERIADRLREIADAIAFEGESFRGR